MTPKKRAQIDKILADVQTSSTPATSKVVIIREVLRASLPAGSELAAGLLPDGTNYLSAGDLDDVISRIRAVLPVYEAAEDPQQRQAELITAVRDSLTSSLFDIDKRIKAEVEQSLRDPARESAVRTQIDDQVWRTMNEKFTRAPWFQIAIAAAAVSITLFSFGLANLNKDVKRADQLVSDFQNRLAKADQELARDERESNARLNASVDSATLKLTQLQNDTMKGLNSDLQKRVTEVEAAKKDAIGSMTKSAQGVKDQAVLANPDIATAKQIAIDAINAEREKQLTAYRENVGQIIANLREPTIRNVLGKAFWLMIMSMVVSVLSLGASVLLLVVEVRR